MTPWWTQFAIVPAIALGAYAWLILVLRLTGKRSLSKLNAFDFSITVAFGSALATVVIDRNVGLIRGAIALATLALLQYIATKLSLWSRTFRRVIRSRPTLLVENGKLFRKAMSYERVTRDEIAEAVRNHGYGRLDQLGAVILETDGSFSIIQRSEKKLDLLYDVRRMGEPSESLTPDSSGAGKKSERPPQRGKKSVHT